MKNILLKFLILLSFVLFASIYDFDKNGEFQYSKKRGFVKISFDRTTGKLVGKEFVYWNTFAEKLDINESGKINSKMKTKVNFTGIFLVKKRKNKIKLCFNQTPSSSSRWQGTRRSARWRATSTRCVAT